MEVQRFEQAILKMAFETDAKITTASVAYYLGIPSRKANELLEGLLSEGVLELDSDSDGNLYYFVPNHSPSKERLTPPHHTAADESWERLEAAADAAANLEEEPVIQSPVVAEHFSTTIEEPAEKQQPFSPSHFSPSQGADGRSAGFESAPDPSSYYQPQPPTARQPLPHQRFRQQPVHSSRFDGIPEGVAARLGRPDARPNRCGGGSVVVESAASCEPKPLAESRPTVTSCAEVDTASKFSTHQDYGGFGFTAPRSSTALATSTGSGEMVLTADTIDQPEHQPGMALLLSLILCGTGQIYNGEVSKGIIMLILCFLLWFVFLGWVVHIWSIVDAVVVAERINRKSSN